jgi:uncharacterized membrane protein
VRDRWLWAGCAVYAALLTALGAIRYNAHRNLVDFGIFVQTSASAFGCFCNPVEGSHWAFHFSPILYAVGALLAVWHSPYAPIVMQSVAGALAAPPVYALVLRARGDVTVARLAALVTLLYPPLAGLIFNDFHENVFAPAAVAWALYLFDAGKLAWAVAAALVAMAVKEDQTIFLTIAGICGAVRFRGTMAGLAAGIVAGLGIVVGTAAFLTIHAHAAAQSGWQPERFYAWTMDDVRGLWPRGLLDRLGFLALAFVPLVLLPFRSRMMWLAAAPLAEVLLSRMPGPYTMGSHYAGAWAGYVLVAFAFAVRRIAARPARVLTICCAALCAVEFAVANPLHPGLNLRARQARDVTLDAYLATLPARADVATQEEAYTHLALDDPNAGLLPEHRDVVPGACYLLIDRDFPESARLQEFGPSIASLLAQGAYEFAGFNGAIELYRRKGCR